MTFLRIDKLQIDLPVSRKYDPNAAAAVQELLVAASAKCPPSTITCTNRLR